jgi:hypothetical protein
MEKFSDNIWVIYALVDPRFPDDIRYVGKTCQTVPKRLRNHLHYAKRAKTNTHLVC